MCPGGCCKSAIRSYGMSCIWEDYVNLHIARIIELKSAQQVKQGAQEKANILGSFKLASPHFFRSNF